MTAGTNRGFTAEQRRPQQNRRGERLPSQMIPTQLLGPDACTYWLVSGRPGHTQYWMPQKAVASFRKTTGQQPEPTRSATDQLAASKRESSGRDRHASWLAPDEQPQSKEQSTNTQPQSELKLATTGKQLEHKRKDTVKQTESIPKATGKPSESTRTASGKQAGSRRKANGEQAKHSQTAAASKRKTTAVQPAL